MGFGMTTDPGSWLFSLSLTLDPNAIVGGRLEIRRRSADPQVSEVLSTPTFGTMIVFATGHQGFEHKINRVASGGTDHYRRVVHVDGRGSKAF